MASTIKEALDGLPRSPRRIARHLAKLGVTGYPRGLGDCPIANYLRQEAQLSGSLQVTRVDVTYGDWPNHIVYTTPKGVSTFIRRFDRTRRYRRLIA